MRGQYSLDFMITLAGFMAMFLVLSSLSLDIGSKFINVLDQRDSILSMEKLLSDVNSLCLMGPGSSIDVKFYLPSNTSIISNGDHMTFVLRDSNHSKSFHLRCNARVFTDENLRYLHGVYQVSLKRQSDYVTVRFAHL